MRVKSQNGNARVGYAQVTLQRLVENGSLLNNGLLRNGICHVLDSQMGGYQRYAQGVVHQNHERLLALA